MSASRTLTTLSLALALGILGVASASAGSDRGDAGGIKIGPLGQAFGSPASAATQANALANSRHKPIHARAAAGEALGSAGVSGVTFDPMSMQHKDPGWAHNYQSWCDVDPSCNGWAEKMREYEGSR